MKNLLKFELRKLWQSKALYIIYAIGLISITLTMVLARVTTAIFGGFNIGSANATELLVSVISGSSLISLTGLYLALFACSDYSQHTIKNIYARGYSRTAVYFSKYLVSLVVLLAVTVIYLCYSFLLGIILGAHVAAIPAAGWGNLALQFLVLFGIHGLYFGLSSMISKTGVAVAVNLFAITLAFNLIDTLLSLIFIKVDNFNFHLADYQLEFIMMPLFSTDPLTKAQLLRALIMPLVYAFVFVGGGWLVSRRRDV